MGGSWEAGLSDFVNKGWRNEAWIGDFSGYVVFDVRGSSLFAELWCWANALEGLELQVFGADVGKRVLRLRSG